ncbi:MAG TPA: aminotransferase class V-fold PLP-dependent enzyme [Vicinamibacterales bacterium]|nr:aminotransferase class V-fold PLP-dependent enzyme [Vicinamibacterales bacterium]
MIDAYEDFLGAFPEYAATHAIDALRVREYRRLDDQHHAYLDYTGGSLHAASQVLEHAALLNEHVYGNPHSASPSSHRMTTLVEQARRAVLEWFNAPPDEYVAIFTANATGALKHVAESYPFSQGTQLLLTADNHNSVNGIREFARAKGAPVDYAPLTVPDLRIDRGQLDGMLAAPSTGPGLFAFPAQSNFTGVRHPLDLIELAHARGWDVLLDAAAFVPTSRLDLSAVKPDFVCVSFYKMFGYPTGVGCLLARSTGLAALRRPWFAGGTVNFATVNGRACVLSQGEAGFEDGTLNYLAIPAVEIGLRHLGSVGLDMINTRVRTLTAWMLQRLVELQHSNGHHLVRLYGPTTTESRGGTITLNFYDPEGHLLDYRRVEEMAGAQGISLRTGCFCNPGAGETAEGITEADVRAALELDPNMNLARFLDLVTSRGGKSAGAIRVSFGLVSNFADAHRFIQFAEGLRDQTRLAIGNVTCDIEAGRIIRDGS